jgi:hypothetical protein
MNYSNLILILSTFMLAIIFLGAVFININIKNSKENLIKLQDEIEQLDLEIKRYRIEIAGLISPDNVLDFIELNNYQPVPLKDIEVLKIED